MNLPDGDPDRVLRDLSARVEAHWQEHGFLRPRWAADPMRGFITRHMEFRTVVQLAEAALADRAALARNDESLRDALSRFGIGLDDDPTPHRGATRRQAGPTGLATVRETPEYPALYALAAIATWSALDAAILDVGRSFIVNRGVPVVRGAPIVHVDLAEHQRLIEYEQSDLLLRLMLEQSNGDGAGAGRFQKILSLFGVAVYCSDWTIRRLLELSQVRHVLVHRAGIADARLAEACPWLALQGGDSVLVTKQHYAAWSAAALDYAWTVVERLESWARVYPD